MLEVVGEEVAGELRRTPDDEGGVVFAPRDDVVGDGIVDELVRFGEKRSRDRFVGVEREEYAFAAVVYHQSHEKQEEIERKGERGMRGF